MKDDFDVTAVRLLNEMSDLHAVVVGEGICPDQTELHRMRLSLVEDFLSKEYGSSVENPRFVAVRILEELRELQVSLRADMGAGDSATEEERRLSFLRTFLRKEYGPRTPPEPVEFPGIYCDCVLRIWASEEVTASLI